MRLSFALVLLPFLAVAFAQTPKADDAYEQFLNGLIEGLEPSLNGSQKTCLNGSDKGYTDVKMFIYYLSEGIKTRNITEILEALPYIEHALTDLEKAAKACNLTQVEADLEKLISEIENNPLTVIVKLFEDIPQVLKLINNAENDWNTQNFTGSGINVGQILLIILTTEDSNKLANRHPRLGRAHKFGKFGGMMKRRQDAMIRRISRHFGMKRNEGENAESHRERLQEEFKSLVKKAHVKKNAQSL